MSVNQMSVGQRPVTDAPAARRLVADATVYEVTLKDRSVEMIDDADAYQQEGPMTTFFRTAPDRQVVDTWSTRIASFRTADIAIIRRRTAPAEGAPSPEGPGLRSA